MYEYKIISHGTEDFPWSVDTIDKLNEMSLLNWELVCVQKSIYYFKKLISSINNCVCIVEDDCCKNCKKYPIK